MIDVSAEGLSVAVASMLPLDPPPSETDIDDALRRIAAAFGASAEIALEARHLLHARFNIRMDRGETLLGNDEHAPWLDIRRGSIDPYYWSRYRQLLIRSGWGPLVVATLDRSTDELLDLLGNAASGSEWRRRGLVVGDVQSGKTATYAALIGKAADSGYKMVILLSGTLENVRRQTQERLDAAFVGFDSRDYLDSAKARRTRHIGVGLIDKRRNGVVFTSRERDFRKSAASALNISLQSLNEPVLVVTKKNKGVLNRLSSWLRTHNPTDPDGRIDLPLLLIDDEADNASINTRLNPSETTAINRSIRDLLGLFGRSSYVGFTATPFANIFIDPFSTDEMLGADLFPRDFIHVLEPPTNYIGMNRLFPTEDPDEVPSSRTGEEDIIRAVDDGSDWLPAHHKKEAEPEGLPESLRVALRCFLLTCAIRDLRESAAREGRGGGIHRSMLVNVSRFTAVQNKIASALHLELEDIRRSVRLYGKLPPASAAAQSKDIAALAQTFAAEFSSCGFAWSAVLPAMNDAIGPVRVQAVNQGTGAASLDYGVTDQSPGVRVIAVGGNSLSRGLTLEGLSTSYFLRNAKAYDTLLQMGRWFGYRDGYPDLCRLWLTDEAEGWYCHVTQATAELKRDFLRMKRRKATPREFGLRVRMHPDTLIITARNKMATGMDVVGERDISLMGRMIETSRLYSDGARNAENRQVLERFFADLTKSYGNSIQSPHSGGRLWSSVSADAVANLLDAFLVHPLNFDFQGDSIANFLRDAVGERDPLLSRCTVALLTSGKGGATELSSLPDLEINAKLRHVKVSREESSLLVSGKGARVGSRPDVRHGLPIEVAERVEKTWRHENPQRPHVPEDAYRAEMRAPLLLVYLLQGQERVETPEGAESRPYKDQLILPALGLHFPGAKDPDAPKRLVRYRLNKIAQAELLPPDIEEDSGDGDIDPDD